MKATSGRTSASISNRIKGYVFNAIEVEVLTKCLKDIINLKPWARDNILVSS